MCGKVVTRLSRQERFAMEQFFEEQFFEFIQGWRGDREIMAEVVPQCH